MSRYNAPLSVGVCECLEGGEKGIKKVVQLAFISKSEPNETSASLELFEEQN